MQDFIIRKNIEKFQKQLAVVTNESERRVLLKLLDEEKAKLPDLSSGPGAADAPGLRPSG